MKKRKRQNKYQTVLTPTPGRVGWIILLLLFLVGVHKGTSYLMNNTRLFRLEAVKISGNEYLPAGVIRRAIDVQTGVPLSSVNIHRIERGLLKIRYLKAVSVNISLPATLLIDVRERKPVLYLVDKSLYMVDEDGLMLKKMEKMPLANIPLATGLGVSSLLKNRKPLLRALDLLQKIHKVDESLVPLISEFHLKKNSWPEIYLVKGGAHVRLGSEHHYERIYRLSQFLKNTDALKHLSDIKAIDLTFKDRVILQKKS